MLYFDESGYTGPDLVNSKQPYFSLASIRITDEEIAQIKKDIGYCEWGKELHFKSMYKSYQGQKMLDKIFNHPLMDNYHVLLSFAYKRYCIYANIVNILVETMYHINGINLYEGAKKLILANGLYCFAILHPNKDLVAEFENNFVGMVRNQSVESVANFYRTTDKLRYDADTREEFFEMLSEIPPTMIYIKNALSNKKFYIDLTIPLFSESIQEWYKRTKEKENVLFDSSEPFFANIEFMESLRDMEVPETVVGYGKGKHVYPLPVGNIKIAKSHEEFGIQLADVFASALCFALTPRNDKFVKYQDKIKSLPIFQNIKINIAPATNDFIEERMKETAEIDPLDFLCEHNDCININKSSNI